MRLDMEIVEDDLPRRIEKAKQLGKCGDWEVLQHLADIKSVRWSRKGKRIRTSSIAAAIDQNMEIRPSTEKHNGK